MPCSKFSPSNLKMKRLYETIEDYEKTYLGATLIDLTNKLGLPLPSIKVLELKKFHKEGLKGIHYTIPTRNPEEKTKYKIFYEDPKLGVHVAIQQIIAGLCERHSAELKGHYFSAFGTRDQEGNAITYTRKEKEKFDPTTRYFKELEYVTAEIGGVAHELVVENDEIRAQLKEKDKMIQQEQEKNKALEEKLAAQVKKFKNQEARVQKKNKENRELKEMLESNDFELDADRDLIEKLRAEKREMQEKIQGSAQEKTKDNDALKEKIDAMNDEVAFLKKVLLENGIEIEEKEVDAEDMEE